MAKKTQQTNGMYSAELKRAEEEFALRQQRTSWKPKEPGDFIAGIVVSITDKPSRFSEAGAPPKMQKVVVLKRFEDEEEVRVFANTSLSEQLSEKAVSVGSKILVRFGGVAPTRSGIAKLYTIVVL